MKSIIFNKDNILKVSEFLKRDVYSYFAIGEPSVSFKTQDGNGEDKNLVFKSGDTIFKDRNGNVFKKLI